MFTASSANVGTLGSVPSLSKIWPVAVSPAPAKKLSSTYCFVVASPDFVGVPRFSIKKLLPSRLPPNSGDVSRTTSVPVFLIIILVGSLALSIVSPSPCSSFSTTASPAAFVAKILFEVIELGVL